MKPLVVATAHRGNKRQLHLALDSIGVAHIEAAAASEVEAALNREEVVAPPVLMDADGLGRDVGTILNLIRFHQIEAVVLTKYPHALPPAKLPNNVRVVTKPPSRTEFQAVVTNLTEAS